MMARTRLLGAAGVALALTLAAVPIARAGEARLLGDAELDRITAGSTATQRQSVARLARLVGYKPQAPFGLSDSPGETAIALLLPAVQSAREAARAAATEAGEFFYSHAFTRGSSDPF